MDPADEQQLLEGGKPLEARMRSGKSERVIVRELPIRQLPRLVELQDDEPALVELYCDKPEGWADGLTVAAHEQVLREGAALNFPVLDRWLDRKVEAVKKLTPAMEKLQALGGSSPTSAPARD